MRVPGTIGATPQHVGDDRGGTRKHGFTRPVAHVADSAVESERARRLLGPGAEKDPLHPAFDLDGHGPPVSVLSHSAPASRVQLSCPRKQGSSRRRSDSRCAIKPGNDTDYPGPLSEFADHGIDIDAT